MRRETARRRGILPADQPSPYQSDLLAFLRDCVWTVDEAYSGQVRAWPSGPGWDPYWEDLVDTVLRYSPLLIDKTRRTMASNFACAFDLWLLAGGVDARWPSLALSQSNRLILIQAMKLEDTNGSASFVERISIMARLAEERGLRKRWPDFPTHTAKFGSLRFSNGSQVSAVPQGADQIRGPGATLIHVEELGIMLEAESSIAAALPALSGIGHLMAISTPNANSFAKRIRDNDLPAPRDRQAQGVRRERGVEAGARG